MIFAMRSGHMDSICFFICKEQIGLKENIVYMLDLYVGIDREEQSLLETVHWVAV